MKKKLALLFFFLLFLLVFAISFSLSQTGLFLLLDFSKKVDPEEIGVWQLMGVVEVRNGAIVSANFTKE